MNQTELSSYLEKMRQGDSVLKMQFNFLFVAFATADSSATQPIPPLRFGKYQSQRPHSYPFYKPYSTLFDLNLIEDNEPIHIQAIQ